MKMVHVTIHTCRFCEEVSFYETIIGLKIERDMRPARNMVFLSDRPGDTCIEIIEDPDAADAGNANLSVGFHTEDVDVKYIELKEAGLEVSDMISPNPHVKFFFVKDPAGVKVQLI